MENILEVRNLNVYYKNKERLVNKLNGDSKERKHENSETNNNRDTDS